jgi:murein hydrolase activator
MKLHSIAITILCFLFISEISAQSRSELEKQRTEMIKEIESTSKVLTQTRESQKESVHKLQILNKRITVRNKVIQSLNVEIQELNERILEREKVIESLENDLEKIRKEYEILVLYSFKNRDKKNLFMYILAADNFNQAYRRLKYLQQYTEYRRKQGEVIMTLKNVLESSKQDLAKAVNEKENLIRAERGEAGILEVEMSEQNKIVNRLQNRERELRKQIEDKNKIADNLQRAIQEMVEAEARKLKTSKDDIYSKLTPEERLISSNFKENKGRLPWPTERGVITSTFGDQPHPVLKGVFIRNNGIDIATTRGAEVRALFNGEVKKVFSYLGANYTVIIRHGNYLTVYQNLEGAMVKPGDKVKTKQIIGKVFTDVSTNTTILHIEIWEELTKLDPSVWLTKM